jgi:hypothetical protein
LTGAAVEKYAHHIVDLILIECESLLGIGCQQHLNERNKLPRQQAGIARDE